MGQEMGHPDRGVFREGLALRIESFSGITYWIGGNSQREIRVSSAKVENFLRR